MLINMNTPMKARANRLRIRARQTGLVLIMVLIVLVAMMFAGIAMLRSVDTATLVAGNIAFRQAATHQGDFGIEQAVSWLQLNNASGSTTLLTTNNNTGYSAIVAGPGSSSTQTWDAYWAGSLDPTPVARPVAALTNSNSVMTLQTTPNGYTVSYVIHRMCPNPGTTSGCVNSPVGATTGANSHNVDLGQAFTQNAAVYYRITAKIEGPRNTVSYVQAMVAM